MMNPISWLKIQIEGVKFGIAYGQKLLLQNPFMTQREVQVRTLVAWAEHLMATDRQHLVKKPEVIETLRAGLDKADMVRNQAFVQAAGPFIN